MQSAPPRHIKRKARSFSTFRPLLKLAQLAADDGKISRLQFLMAAAEAAKAERRGKTMMGYYAAEKKVRGNGVVQADDGPPEAQREYEVWADLARVIL